MPYIYKITNNINNKCYIGQTTQTPEIRFKQHLYNAKFAKQNSEQVKNNRRYNMPIVKVIIKYGEENFSFELLEQCDIEQLNDKEIEYISKYNSYKDGYNATLGGTLKDASLEDDLAVCESYKSGITDIYELVELHHRKASTIRSILQEHGIRFKQKNFSELTDDESKRLLKFIIGQNQSEKQ